MATTINAYSVSLGLDASGLVDGANLSRSEISKLTRDIEAARNPAERYSLEQDRLTRALNQGAISEATYNRLLDDKRQKLFGVNSQMTDYTSKTELAIGAMSGLAAGALAFASAAVAAGVEGVRQIREIQGAIDDTVDSANRLGLEFNDLNSLRFASSILAGGTGQEIDAAIQKMQIRIADALGGDEAALNAFGQLGLQAGELLAAGPVKSLGMIADAYQDLNSHAERLNVTTEIFGKSGTEIVAVLESGSDAIQEQAGWYAEVAALSQEQLTAIGEANDAWQKIGVEIDGIQNKLAADMAPLVKLVADDVGALAKQWGGLDEVIHSSVDSMALLYGTAQDFFELQKAVTGIGTGFIGQNPISALMAAGDMTNAMDNVARLDEERRKNQLKAAADQQDKILRDVEERKRREAEADMQMRRDGFNEAVKQAEEERRIREQNAIEEAEIVRQMQIDRLELEIRTRKEQLAAMTGVSNTASSYEVGSADAAKFLQGQVGDLQQQQLTKLEEQKRLLDEAVKELQEIRKKPVVQRRR